MEGAWLSRGDALGILRVPVAEVPALVEAVYPIRKKYKGDVVGIQILTNARSGNCSQDCAYCAQARDSEADIAKYRLAPYEKLRGDGLIAREKNLARHCIGLSGIRFTDAEILDFAACVRELKKEADTHICCSIGFLTPGQARILKEAGVNRINHNLNTSRNYYPSICTTHSYDERIANIKMLQALGFEICCGGIVGMGESEGDVADMLLEIRDINPQSVPVNFLIPIAGTGLHKAASPPLTPDYCLKVLCLARLLLPEKDIRATAGRELYLKGREKEMFMLADSIFASGYLTAGGQSIDETIRLVRDAGFEYRIK
jgi:biotin synthase